MILTELIVGTDEFTRRTGWELKPEGLCRGSVCVPAPDVAGPDGTIDVRRAAERLGMPLVHDERRGLWALGPATASGRALDAAEVPDLELQDVDGRPFALSSLRGRKVVMVAWASW
jgi:hypothetical protein